MSGFASNVEVSLTSIVGRFGRRLRRSSSEGRAGRRRLWFGDDAVAEGVDADGSSSSYCEAK